MSLPLPLFVSHKQVRALKIAMIEERVIDGHVHGVRLSFADERYEPKALDLDYALRLSSKRGDDLGYYVVYADGYESWSPTQAFEDGYSALAPTAPLSAAVQSEHIMQFFSYAHLPEQLQQVSSPFCALAEETLRMVPRNPERSTALRKLLEAKDAAVRAYLAKPVQP